MYQNYLDVLAASNTYIKTSQERTFFSLGGKAHYENPLSDVLAFFCDIRAEHDLGDLVLRALLNVAGLSPTIPYIQMSKPPFREFVTENNKRMDLVIFGNDWVLVIENKVKHRVDNPLDDYEKYIREKYPKKRRYFLILSVAEETGLGPWKNILYKDLYSGITTILHKRFINIKPNKWHTLLREFLVNISQIIGVTEMDQREVDFIKTNYKSINELIEKRSKYFDHLSEEIANICSKIGLKTITAVEDWGDMGNAIRVNPTTWNKKANFAVRISPNGEMELRLYDYTLVSGDEKEMDEHYKHDAIIEPPWPEFGGTTRAYKFKPLQEISDIEEYIAWANEKIK